METKVSNRMFRLEPVIQHRNNFGSDVAWDQFFIILHMEYNQEAVDLVRAIPGIRNIIIKM